MVMVGFRDILMENILLFKVLCVFETRYFRKVWEKFGGQSMREKRDLSFSVSLVTISLSLLITYFFFSQLFRELFGVAWIRCKCIVREGEIKCELSYNSAQYINVTYCMTCELGLKFEHT